MTEKPLKTDQELSLQLELLRKGKTVSVKARVAWIKKVERTTEGSKDHYRIGAEFISLSPKDKQALSQELKLYYE